MYCASFVFLGCYFSFITISISIVIIDILNFIIIFYFISIIKLFISTHGFYLPSPRASTLTLTGTKEASVWYLSAEVKPQGPTVDLGFSVSSDKFNKYMK